MAGGMGMGTFKGGTVFRSRHSISGIHTSSLSLFSSLLFSFWFSTRSMHFKPPYRHLAPINTNEQPTDNVNQF